MTVCSYRLSCVGTAQQLVSGGDGLRVGLEGALRGRSAHELFGEVDVRLLDAPATMLPATTEAGSPMVAGLRPSTRLPVSADAVELVR